MKNFTAFILILAFVCSLFGGCSDDTEMSVEDFYALKDKLSLPFGAEEDPQAIQDNLDFANDQLANAYMAAHEGSKVVDNFIKINNPNDFTFEMWFYAIVEDDSTHVVITKCDYPLARRLFRYIMMSFNDYVDFNIPAVCPDIKMNDGIFLLDMPTPSNKKSLTDLRVKLANDELFVLDKVRMAGVEEMFYTQLPYYDLETAYSNNVYTELWVATEQGIFLLDIQGALFELTAPYTARVTPQGDAVVSYYER